MTSLPNNSLESFLESIQLQQYHETFIKAGATDQDLPQLIQFNDQELSEFLSALDMLPFHCIKFKKALRELKLSGQETGAKQTSYSTREFIASHAIIYGKKKNRPLTSYEEAINRASLQLALDKPLLISKKGELFDLAKKKLLEDGYRYKRGSSRSKLRQEHKHTINKTVSLENTDQILAKRQENAQRMSEERLEKIHLLQQQVDHALKCRQATENQLSDGVRRDQLTQLAMEAEMIRFEETKVRLNKEISKLKAQERKHQWYKRRKLERSASQSTDESFSSQENLGFSVYESSSQSSCSSACHLEYDITSTTLCCSRESDVRASSISNYDR